MYFIHRTLANIITGNFTVRISNRYWLTDPQNKTKRIKFLQLEMSDSIVSITYVFPVTQRTNIGVQISFWKKRVNMHVNESAIYLEDCEFIFIIVDRQALLNVSRAYNGTH